MIRGYVRLVMSIAFAAAALACADSGHHQEAAAAAPAPQQAPPEPFTLADPAPGTAPPNPYSAEQIARGAALVAFGSCNDCHTPFEFDEAMGGPVPDMARMLSGHPEGAPDPGGQVGPMDMGLLGPTGTSIALPFGTVYAVNLTPDMDTGTGSWTEEMWLNIWRTGSHLGGNGRPVLPPMPWYSVASLPDEDQIAIFAYLRSIPPIRNGVPTFNPPPPVQDAISRANAAIAQEIRSRKEAAKAVN